MARQEIPHSAWLLFSSGLLAYPPPVTSAPIRSLWMKGRSRKRYARLGGFAARLFGTNSDAAAISEVESKISTNWPPRYAAVACYRLGMLCLRQNAPEPARALFGASGRTLRRRYPSRISVKTFRRPAIGPVARPRRRVAALTGPRGAGRRSGKESFAPYTVAAEPIGLGTHEYSRSAGHVARGLASA